MNTLHTARMSVFNWDACIKYFHDAVTVKDILTQFRQDLIKDRRALNRAFKEQHWEQITYLLDRMLGGACYCGVPHLCDLLKAAAPAGKSRVLTPVTLDRINQEIDEILAVFANLAQNDWMPSQQE